MLDGDPATLTVLADIVDAVGGEIEVLFDSGVRRGSDVVKAVAIGARAVLVGRSWLWGLAADGEAGVRAVLEAYRGQIDDALGALGCPAITELDRSYVRFPGSWSGSAEGPPRRRGSGSRPLSRRQAGSSWRRGRRAGPGPGSPRSRDRS